MRTKGQQKNSTKPLKNDKKRKKYFQKWGGKKGGQSSCGYGPITKDRRQPTGIRTPKKVKKIRENCEKNVVGEQKNEAEGRRGREPSEVVTIVYSLLFITKIQRTKTKSKNKKKNNLLKKSETHDFFGQHQGSASNSRFGFRTLFAHFPCFRRLLGHFFCTSRRIFFFMFAVSAAPPGGENNTVSFDEFDV